MRRHGRITTGGMIIGLLIALALVLAVIALTRYDTTGRTGNRLGKEFVYDVAELARVDPNLILYEEISSPIPTGFTEAHCLAVDGNGLIYVGGDGMIRRLNQAGNRLGDIGLTTERKTRLTPGHREIDLGQNTRIEQRAMEVAFGIVDLVALG